MQSFESPEDRLHIGGIHRLISVIKIDPPAEAIDHLLPLLAVTQDQVSADLVEVANAVLKNIGTRLEAEILLRLILDRKAVAIPSPSPRDVIAHHGEIA